MVPTNKKQTKNKTGKMLDKTKTISVDLPFPGQTCVTVFEEFADGSWAIFFEDCPNIIGGSNDSWEDALRDLAVIVRDILQDIEKYEDSVSLYQEERRQFIKKIFGL